MSGSTGFSPAIKLAARARTANGDPDQAVCECHGFWLGRYGGVIQHRVARGSGGTSRPEISSVVNAAVMCHPGHALAEARDPGMYERGFWRWNAESPAGVPLMIWTRDGGFTRWLTPEGGYSETRPQRAGAA
jgi:hypothetical protein